MRSCFYFIAGAAFLFGLLWLSGYMPFTDRQAPSFDTGQLTQAISAKSGGDRSGCSSCKWS